MENPSSTRARASGTLRPGARTRQSPYQAISHGQPKDQTTNQERPMRTRTGLGRRGHASGARLSQRPPGHTTTPLPRVDLLARDPVVRISPRMPTIQRAPQTHTRHTSLPHHVNSTSMMYCVQRGDRRGGQGGRTPLSSSSSSSLWDLLQDVHRIHLGALRWRLRDASLALEMSLVLPGSIRRMQSS